MVVLEEVDEVDEVADEKADSSTERLLEAIHANDVAAIYATLDEGADANFVFGQAYDCPEGFTPLMAACYAGHVDAVNALLRAGADPCYANNAEELTVFWAIDGGPEVLRAVCDYGADVDQVTSKGWTPLSYASACGAYPRRFRPDATPEAILKEYGATMVGYGPPPMMSEQTARGGLNDVDDEDEDGGAGPLEAEEAVVLPDGGEVREQWEAQKAVESEARREQEEDEEMKEIMKDLSRNPFIKEKGRALRE